MYRVLSVKAYVRVWNTANCDILAQLSTSRSTSPSNTTDADKVNRQEAALCRILPRVAAGSANSETEFAVDIPLHKVQGFTRDQYLTEESTASLIGGNSALASYLHVQAWNIHQGGYISAGGAGGDPIANVAQLGDSDAQITSSTGCIGYSLRMIQTVQFLMPRNATAA